MLVNSVQVLTAAGRSAVAVIRWSGPDSDRMLAECFAAATERPMRTGQVRFGSWHGGRQDVIGESVVVTAVHDGAGQGYEVHCHGGPIAVGRVVDDLRGLGCEEVELFEGSSELECTAEKLLCHCTTARTAGVVMDQIRGTLRRWLANPGNGGITAAQILRYADLTMRISQPLSVVLVGSPNVGKSSLINALLGYERSITLDQPGTTRDLLHASTAMDGWPVQLSDTAGLRDTDEEIESEGIRRASAAAAAADLVVLVADSDSSFQTDQGWKDVIRVRNKVDLQQGPISVDEIGTVATTGAGVDRLRDAITRRLLIPALPPGSPAVLNQHDYELVAGVTL